jgi:hypothetical protein
MLGWNRPFPGHERAAMEAFDAIRGLLRSLREAKKIDNFEVYILGPHGGDFNGFVLVHADVEHLNALRSNRDWRNLVDKAFLVIDKLGLIPAWDVTNEPDLRYTT